MGGGRVGKWEVGWCGVWEVGGEWEGYGNGQVRFDRFDRTDSMPVFAVGWLGMKDSYRVVCESGLLGQITFGESAA